jgi:hypothetical protein
VTTGPTLAGFNTFIRGVMAIDPLYLPDNAPIIGYAYNAAAALVNPMLAQAGCPPGSQWSIYAMAVYNLGGSNLIHYAQDQDGRVYFAEQRKSFRIDKFSPGVVASTSDEGTSVSLLNPEFMKTMTLQNLQAIKDPWGRAYLGFAQSFGPMWGFS